MKYRTMFWALVTAAVFAGAAFAHSVGIFVAVQDGQVVVHAYFSRSIDVQGGEVVVKTTDGRIVFEGTTDKEGFCAFVPSERVDLEIIVKAGNGHVSSPFMIYADELTMFDEAGEASASEAQPGNSANGSGDTTSPAAKPAARPSAKKPSSELRARFGSEEEGAIRLRDILGGLGWIVGLTGIAMYFFGRRKKDGGQDVSR